MTVANRVQICGVRESTPGVTPTTPRMRKKRYTGEALTFAPEYLDSDEIRDDRMMGDPTKTMQAAAGSINDELSYPDDESLDSEFYRSAFFNTWQNTPQRFNDGTADSAITDVAATGGVITVASGAAFAVGHLVRLTGFGVAGNNGLFRITTGSATVPAVGNSLLTDEAAPAASARVKVVGLQGASGDLVAAADGITSTALDFTTLGILVGQWIKIGGTGASFRFATEALNGWARITAIAAGKLTLDNLPTGWTTDAGTGKTLRIFFGDRIKNGITHTALTLEKGFLGQAVPTYIAHRGMEVGQVVHTIVSRRQVTRTWTFTGLGGSMGTTALDASPDPQTLGQPIAANANVGRLAENGQRLTSPNWARSFEFTINNQLRTVEDVQETSPQKINEGEFQVTGRLETYFGDDSLLAKFYAGTPTALNSRVQRNGQAMIFQVPRATYRSDGNPAVSGKNTDVMLPLGFQASYDTLTAAHLLLDRIEFYQD
ncbi:MAG: phage tail tube protein [Bradyrhizobium sp.]|uniref:phage tail tube protein n=1 Tax=Bradyrhizobium sp. TaxID=376 RepID=UPI003D148BFA